MMSRNELTERIREAEPALRSAGVTHMVLFGSRARGDARHDSDVDLMIDVDKPNFSMLDLIGIERHLGEKLGLEVQILMRRSLSDRLRERTADDIIEIF